MGLEFKKLDYLGFVGGIADGRLKQLGKKVFYPCNASWK